MKTVSLLGLHEPSLWIFGLCCMCCFRTAAQDEQTSAKEVTEESSKGHAEPKLLALTWQSGIKASSKFSDIPWWKPNGELVDKAERAELEQEIYGTEVQWMNQKQATPLVAIFEYSDNLPAGIDGIRMEAATDNHRTRGGSYLKRMVGKTTKSRVFSVSTATAFTERKDFEWPEKVDLNLTFPSTDMKLIKKLDAIPKGSVKLQRGVSWSVEPKAGYDPGKKPAERFPAGVLLVSKEASDLIEVSVRVYAKGDKRPLDEQYVTLREIDGELFKVRVSKRFPEADELERIEFYRMLYRKTKVAGVVVRTDLLPKQEAAKIEPVESDVFGR